MMVEALGRPWSVQLTSPPASIPKNRFRSLPWLPHGELWWRPSEKPRRATGSNIAATSPIVVRAAVGTFSQAVSVKSAAPMDHAGTFRRPSPASRATGRTIRPSADEPNSTPASAMAWRP